MQSDSTNDLFQASIAIELKVSQIYALFAATHEPDRPFWEPLEQEEIRHAQLLRTAQDSFNNRGRFPCSLIISSLSELNGTIAKLDECIAKLTRHPPTRLEACLIAIELEQEAGEIHFATFMEKAPKSPIEQVFQQLNLDDKDHLERISSYSEKLKENR